MGFVLSGFADEICPEFDGQLEALKEWGVSHIELRGIDGINVSDLTDEKLQEVKEKLTKAGISVSSIGSPIGKVDIREPFAPHLEKLKRTLHIAKELNAPYVRMFSFYYPLEQGPEAFQDEIFSRMEQMIHLARQIGVVLLHENEKEIYGDTDDRCLRLMERFYGPNFKGVFDFSNFVECGVDTLQAWEKLSPYIAYVHVKDCRIADKLVVPAGEGDGHIREILSELQEKGYEGFLSLEPHLADFAGFHALEKNPQARKAMNGKEAWKLALDSLSAILREIQ